jgi:tetratricopeptide (TPR) repeat protein
MRIKASYVLFLTLAASCTAFGAGGGPSMPSSSPAMQTREPPSPEEQARAAYNSAIRGVEKGDELLADAARQSDARKQEKLRKKATDAYAGAARKFAKAVEVRPGMHEAWNYLGYCNRKMGRFDAALAAYDRALELKPEYAEAVEYRGHAYLGLNRLPEAKAAYLSLFASNRKLAASLLGAMQQWVGEHRGGAGVDPGSFDAFASWVDERSAIASQTAALTREGASTWK